MEPSKICLLTAGSSSAFHINTTMTFSLLIGATSHEVYLQQKLDHCLPVLVSVMEGSSHFSRTEDWKVLMKKAQSSKG